MEGKNNGVKMNYDGWWRQNVGGKMEEEVRRRNIEEV